MSFIICSNAIWLIIECLVQVSARWHPESAHKPEIEDAPVFYPTEEVYIFACLNFKKDILHILVVMCKSVFYLRSIIRICECV